jgi:hypothetical protein
MSSFAAFVWVVLPFFIVNVIFVFWQGAPGWLNYVPDLLLVMVTPLLILRVIYLRTWASIPLRYLVPFGVFCYVAIAGIALNNVAGETVVAGIRMYFKWLPFFLLPFAFHFSNEALIKISKLLLLLFLAQVPLVGFQRFVTHGDSVSGDYAVGAFDSTGSFAALFSVALCCLFVLYVHSSIKPYKLLILALLIAIPPSITEIRALPIFLIFGVAVAVYLLRSRISIRTIAVSGTALTLILVIFVIAYEKIYGVNEEGTYIEMMTPKNLLDSYNLTGVRALPIRIPRSTTDGALIGKAKPERSKVVSEVGRLDTLRMPFDAMFPHAWMYLLLGLGIGNVDSEFGAGADYLILSTEYSAMGTTWSALVWESGLIGGIAFFAFVCAALWDALRLARLPGFDGTLGTISTVFCSIILLATIYTNLFHMQEILSLFFVLVGVCIVRRRNAKAVNNPSVASLRAGFQT